MKEFNEDFLFAKSGEADQLDEGMDAVVMSKVNEMLELDADIAEKEEKLAELKAVRLSLSSKVIPELFQERGWTLLKLKNKWIVEIKETVRLSVPSKDEQKKAEALEFLRTHDGGQLIKEEIFLAEYKPELAEFLQDNNVPFEVSRSVNTASLTSWFTGLLGMKKGSIQTIAFSEIPAVFSPFLQKETKVSK